MTRSLVLFKKWRLVLRSLFKLTALIVTLMIISPIVVMAKSKKKCIGDYEIEGSFYLDKSKAVHMIANKNTHQEVSIKLESFDKGIYRCVLQGCWAKLKVNIVGRELTKGTRRFLASKAKFLKELKPGLAKPFFKCGVLSSTKTLKKNIGYLH